MGDTQKIDTNNIKATNSEKRKGYGVFSEWLLGGLRAFHDLSAGETAAPDLSGECGGGKNPPWISRRKDQAVRLGTEEKIS